jgi:hypothetical protein
LLKHVEELIRHDRAIAPIGTFPERPEIVEAGFPKTISKSRQYTIEPDIKGLGSADNIVIRAWDYESLQPQTGDFRNGTKSEGTLSTTLRVIGGPSIKRRITLLVANTDNVFVRKDMEVRVTND